MAKRKHHSEELIIRILKEAETGMPVADLLRKYNISQGTFYRWKSAYSGMGATHTSVTNNTKTSVTLLVLSYGVCLSQAKHSTKGSVIVCMFYRGFAALGFS
jgi:putative transposase